MRKRSLGRVVRRAWFLGGIPIAIAVLALAASGPALAAEGLTQISSDPYTSPPGQHRTQVEPDTFSFGKTVVSAFQSGRINNGGASNIGWATSLDGGVSWRHGFLPSTTVNATPRGRYIAASDASVAYDARDKVWLISYLAITAGTPVDVLVSRSTDGGLTWGAPVVVDNSGHFLDKNWTVCDNSTSSRLFGRCYTEFDDYDLGDLEQMSTSADGGLTWGAPKATADGSHGIGGQPLVQPNGTVIVPYVGLDSPYFLFTISSFQSVDGGASWSASTLVSQGDFHNPNPGGPKDGIRADIPLPTAEIDAAGKVYVVWSDCRFEASCASSDLVLSTSSDGVTWSTVRRIPIDAIGSHADHFIPGLAVDRGTAGASAELALTYYYYPQANCTVSSCQLNVGEITSKNGGRTWSHASHVAGPMQLTWLASTTQGFMVGDYISTSISQSLGIVAPAFAVAAKPSGTTFNEATFTSPTEIGGGPVAAGTTEQPVASTRSPNAAASARRIPPTAF